MPMKTFAAALWAALCVIVGVGGILFALALYSHNSRPVAHAPQMGWRAIADEKFELPATERRSFALRPGRYKVEVTADSPVLFAAHLSTIDTDSALRSGATLCGQTGSLHSAIDCELRADSTLAIQQDRSATGAAISAIANPINAAQYFAPARVAVRVSVWSCVANC